MSILIFIIGCKKNDNNSSITHYYPSEEIFFTLLDSDAIDTIIETSTNIHGQDFSSLKAFDIDLDKDGNFDFSIYDEHHIYWGFYNGDTNDYRELYHCVVTMHSLDTSCYLYGRCEDYKCNINLGQSVIENSYSLGNYFEIYASPNSPFCCGPFTDDTIGYLGFNIYQKYGWIKFQMNMNDTIVKVLEWAYNNTYNSDILVGQTK